MSRRGTGDSDGRRREDNDEETGWIADLRKAKKANNDLSRSDFADGGTDRWAKLSALSGDPEASSAKPETPKGRRRAPDAPAAEPELPRRPPKASPEPPPREAAREPIREPIREAPREPDPQSLVGRRARREPDAQPDPKSLIGRRARREPEPPAREPDPDPKSLIGRRARREPEPPQEKEPLIGRRARREPEPAAEPPRAPEREPLIGRRARPEPPPERDPLIGRRARREAEPFPMPDSLRDSGVGRGRRDRPEPLAQAPPPPPPAMPPAEPARRRALFGVSGEFPRRPIFGDRRRQAPPPQGPASGPPNPISTPPRPVSTPPRAPVSPPPPSASPSSGPSAPPMGMPRPVSTPPRAPVSPPPMSAPPVSPSPMSASMSAPMSAPIPSPISGSPVSTPPRPPAPPAGTGPRVRLAAGVDMIRGARSEVRKQLREQQRLRMWTLIALVVAVVGALPFYFVLREVSRDPVITSLDSLSVPAWAVTAKDDNITGSRWCLMDCRYRERTAQSQRPIAETAKVYQEALIAAGWSQLTGLPGCPPDVAEGEHASCWRRDEFTLDLWIREPAECTDNPLLNRPTVGPSPGTDPSASPGSGQEVNVCKANSSVTIKVFNAIADERLRWNGETAPPNPEMGELTDEDLNPSMTPTPAPS